MRSSSSAKAIGARHGELLLRTPSIAVDDVAAAPEPFDDPGSRSQSTSLSGDAECRAGAFHCRTLTGTRRGRATGPLQAGGCGLEPDASASERRPSAVPLATTWTSGGAVSASFVTMAGVEVVLRTQTSEGSLPDARDILEDLTTREVKLSIGGSLHDPTDPVGRLLFNVLAMVAEYESDLIRLRTKEGMRVAKAKGHLRGRPPKLNPRQEEHLVMLHRAGEHSTAELSDLFGVGRSTVYRVIECDGQRSKRSSAPRPDTERR
jgi:hypothetical protein